MWIVARIENFLQVLLNLYKAEVQIKCWNFVEIVHERRGSILLDFSTYSRHQKEFHIAIINGCAGFGKFSCLSYDISRYSHLCWVWPKKKSIFWRSLYIFVSKRAKSNKNKTYGNIALNGHNQIIMRNIFAFIVGYIAH